MTSKVATPLTPTRRRAALMVLRAREARGWSQERAAHELGIGVRTLRDIEAGKARMTALEALIELEGLEAEAQVVERRFPKPQVAGSTPACLAVAGSTPAGVSTGAGSQPAMASGVRCPVRSVAGKSAQPSKRAA